MRRPLAGVLCLGLLLGCSSRGESDVQLSTALAGVIDLYSVPGVPRALVLERAQALDSAPLSTVEAVETLKGTLAVLAEARQIAEEAGRTDPDRISAVTDALLGGFAAEEVRQVLRSERRPIRVLDRTLALEASGYTRDRALATAIVETNRLAW